MKPEPDGNFSMVGSVTGPPLFVDGQVAEGYANDDNISYFVKEFPSANSFSAVGLPAGLLNSSKFQEFLYEVEITMSHAATNSFGEDQGVLSLSIIERSGFSHRVDLNCSASWFHFNKFPFARSFDRSIKTLV